MDSESVVVVTDVLMPEEGSSASHLGSELELDVVTKNWSVVDGSSLVNLPSLVETLVAIPVNDMSVVVIVSTVDIQTFSTVVSNVSSRSVEPSDSLVDSSRVWLDVSSNTNSPVLSSLVRDSITSSSPGSNGLGSSVEGPPLLVVRWVVVLDSESELVSSDVLVPEESSVVEHS